jgi:hypothetical protein
VTALVFDAGALIALERNDRTLWAMLRLAATERADVQVPTGVIAQAWRDGARQARLVQALGHCRELPLDGAAARAAGLLCDATDTSDIVDASVALAAAGSARTQPTTVITSDVEDIALLLDQLAGSAKIVQA